MGETTDAEVTQILNDLTDTDAAAAIAGLAARVRADLAGSLPHERPQELRASVRNEVVPAGVGRERGPRPA